MTTVVVVRDKVLADAVRDRVGDKAVVVFPPSQASLGGMRFDRCIVIAGYDEQWTRARTVASRHWLKNAVIPRLSVGVRLEYVTSLDDVVIHATE